MAIENKSHLLSKIGMIAFLIFIVLFVSISSWMYIDNSSNVEIRIKTDNEVNKEKTAVNEALTKTLVMKNDTISTFKTVVKRKDSLYLKEVEMYKREIRKVEHKNDSLEKVLRNFKQSDIQPIQRTDNE